MENVILIAVIGLVVLAIIVIARTALVVPQQSAYVIENLGKYSRTLQAGFHILIPFVERVAYKHTLKEMAIDVQERSGRLPEGALHITDAGRTVLAGRADRVRLNGISRWLGGTFLSADRVWRWTGSSLLPPTP